MDLEARSLRQDVISSFWGWGEALQAFLLASGFVAIVGIPWLLGTSLHFYLQVYMVFSLTTWVHVQISTILYGCHSYCMRAHLSELIFIWTLLQRPYFQIRPYSQVLEHVIIIFLRNMVQPITAMIRLVTWQRWMDSAGVTKIPDQLN